MFIHSVTPSFTPIKTGVNWCEGTKFKMQQILPDKKKTVCRQTVHQGFEESNDENTEQAKLGGRCLNKSVGEAGEAGEAGKAGKAGEAGEAGEAGLLELHSAQSYDLN